MKEAPNFIKDRPIENQEENQFCTKDIIMNGVSIRRPMENSYGLDFLHFVENLEMYKNEM